MKRRLNEKEEIFVRQYARTGDAPYAATKAGYNPSRPNTGYELLAKPLVQTALENRKKAFDVLCDALPAVALDHRHRLLGEQGYEKPTNEQYFKGVQQFYNAVKLLGISLPEGADPDHISATDFGHLAVELSRKADLLAAELAARRKMIDAVEIVDAPDPPDDAPKSGGGALDETDIFL